MNDLIPFVKKIIALPDWLPDWDVSEHPQWRGTVKGLWIEPGMLLTLINGWQVAQWAMAISYRLQPRLRAKLGPGRPPTYSDETVLLSVVVMRVWRKGYESFSGWLGRNPGLAESLGYTIPTAQGQFQTISSSQLSRRARQLGFWPFLFFFIGLVWQLIRLGAISGRDLIVDASILKAWYHHDPEAGWSYPTRGRGSIFGYKIHTLLCRQESLPIFFWITPANAADGPWAIPLLAAALVLYGFQIQLVRADAAYFSKKILFFIYHHLRAHPFVDYNVRRNNKQIVTLEFIIAWEGLMAPRSDIERHFAWAKRYFGLKYFQIEGWLNMMTYACCTYIAMLTVAVVAYRCQRPELTRSRTQVLAWA
jgi:Transposase DDE domain